MEKALFWSSHNHLSCVAPTSNLIYKKYGMKCNSPLGKYLLTLPPGKPGTQLGSCLRTLLYCLFFIFFLRNHQPALIFLQFQRTQAKFSLDVREREKSLSPCLEAWRTNVNRLWFSSKKFLLSNLRFKWIPSLSFIKCGGLVMLAEPFLWAPFTILAQVVRNPSLEYKNTS